jgi:hypothetical protein
MVHHSVPWPIMFFSFGGNLTCVGRWSSTVEKLPVVHYTDLLILVSIKSCYVPCAVHIFA